MPFMDTLCYYTLVVIGASCALILVVFALMTAVTMIKDVIIERQQSKKMYIITYCDYGLMLKAMVFAHSMEKAVGKLERRLSPPYTIIDVEEINQ